MFYVGVDLGKKVDFTAIAIVEREESALRWMAPAFPGLRVRHLERLALGTPYTAVVERIRELTAHPALAGQCRLVVDATGVGNPVVDMLRHAGLPCGVTAVTITGGEKANGRGEWWHVPKQDLLSGVHLLLEREELKISRRMPDSGSLVRELVSMQASNGRSGEHDDLVMAVALACWQAGRGSVGPAGRRLPGI